MLSKKIILIAVGLHFYLNKMSNALKYDITNVNLSQNFGTL